MSSMFKKILCPIDLDPNGLAALDYAEDLAKLHDADVIILHVINVALDPKSAPMYAQEFEPQAAEIRAKLNEMGRKHLRDVRHEARVELGEPASVIIDVARSLPADLLIMPSHRRRFSRFFLGSIAETVMNGVECPVLTVKNRKSDRLSVAAWMSADPVTVSPDAPLTEAQRLMREGNFRTLPVVVNGKLVGVITDRDVRSASAHLEDMKVAQAMSADLVTIAPDTSILEASKHLAEHKHGALPVIEDGRFIGIISTEDLLKAFAEVR